MDISRWTNEERVKLPDFVFGSREPSGVAMYNPGGGSYAWEIAELSLPDKCMIWEVCFWALATDSNSTYFRVGLRDTVPTSVAEMDTAMEIMPYFGLPLTGPNQIGVFSGEQAFVRIILRKGITAGGKKFVVQSFKNGVPSKSYIWIVTSPLPKNISGWLLYSFLTKVR